jgi:Zn-dependent peptidase ImmA (M78 family)
MTISVPYVAKEAIEEDAKALLADYARVRSITVVPPIPIEDIVEKHLKLLLEFDDTHKLFGIPRDPKDAPDILGAMFFDDRRIVIDESLDPDENRAIEGRYRFTLAHEGGGHWRLHRSYFETDPAQATMIDGRVAPSVVCRSSQAKAPIEWQADYYASCLLMPRDQLFTAWENAFGTSAPFVFDRDKHPPMARSPKKGPRPIGALLKEVFQTDYDPYFDQIAKQFTQMFLVSPIAMRIRLEDLGLLLRGNSSAQIFADGT